MIQHVKQQAREIWQRLLHINATPERIGAGFALGMFVSFLPIVPFRTMVALGLALLLRQNVIAALAGKSVTLLYFYLLPLIWFAEYRIGSQFIDVASATKFDRAHLGEILHMRWDVFTAMLLGSVLIATPISLLTYLAVKRFAARHFVHKQ